MCSENLANRGLVRENPIWVQYAEKLQEMIDRYNQGSNNIDAFFKELRELVASLNEEEKRAVREELTEEEKRAVREELTEEEKRAVREELTEEELAVFDLLTKPDPTLTKAEEARVKAVARDILVALKREKLVLDWKKKQATRAAVQVAIEDALDQGLPDVYDRSLFARKSAAVFEHVFSAYEGDGRSVYEAVA